MTKCEHDKQAGKCIKCYPHLFCDHKRLVRLCKQCSPYECPECKTICPVGRASEHEKTKRHKRNIAKKHNLIETYEYLLNKIPESVITELATSDPEFKKHLDSLPA